MLPDGDAQQLEKITFERRQREMWMRAAPLVRVEQRERKSARGASCREARQLPFPSFPRTRQSQAKRVSTWALAIRVRTGLRTIHTHVPASRRRHRALHAPRAPAVHLRLPRPEGPLVSVWHLSSLASTRTRAPELVLPLRARRGCHGARARLSHSCVLYRPVDRALAQHLYQHRRELERWLQAEHRGDPEPDQGSPRARRKDHHDRHIERPSIGLQAPLRTVAFRP
ncbi:hypothetical protein EXIGLDRAFT_455652 [Exidia glandulosa HHB12029]|uniref:Uncharacterized protein n=1 Tax=Exidia glandulosa HHB12029 TaxID=1314781 RepID=A0A165PLT2_EXIGL|nr:hypothetical protein EXIGLDRAFT_455652 [Exidia glandulosa HHB12029]